jgi:hypothetical protein
MNPHQRMNLSSAFGDSAGAVFLGRQARSAEAGIFHAPNSGGSAMETLFSSGMDGLATAAALGAATLSPAWPSMSYLSS